jgi:hypothetical protein
MRRIYPRKAKGQSVGGQFSARVSEEDSIALPQSPWGSAFRQTILERLSESTAVEDRVLAARNEDMDASVVDYLAFDGAAPVRIAAARNSKLAWRLLIRLTNDPDPQVRAAAAGNFRLGIPELDKMLRDDDETVINSIAEAVQSRGLGRIVSAPQCSATKG